MLGLNAIGVMSGVLFAAAAQAEEAPEQESEAPASISTHVATCPQDYHGPSVLVRVSGFKDRDGQLRVELYPDDPEDFLAPGRALLAAGKVFQRIDIPTPQTGDAEVCVVVPTPGTYAMAILHDRNANGKLNPFSDGYGFPNNPRLGYGKPDVKDVAFPVGETQTTIEVVLNYWTGFSARPIRSRRGQD